jgi:hypothetical protein
VVVVTGTPIPSLVMPPLPPAGASTAVRSGRQLTVLELPPQRSTSFIYQLSTMDEWGRVVARVAIQAVGWQPGTPLTMTGRAGLIEVVADPAGPRRLTRQGHLRVPLALRRWHHLQAGSQILVVGDATAGRLVLHPLAVVDTLIAQLHGEVFGGETA